MQFFVKGLYYNPGAFIMEKEVQNKIQLFDNGKIRSVWDSEEQKWYFSVVDVIAILTESANPRDYWFKMKKRVHSEDGIELSTICRQLKMMSSDGKLYNTDAADTQALLRIIQSVPSKKAKPFKQWLAKVGSENWINQRIKSIEVRKALTDEWDKSGVKQGTEYAILTDFMYKTWAEKDRILHATQFIQHCFSGFINNSPVLQDFLNPFFSTVYFFHLPELICDFIVSMSICSRLGFSLK